MPDGPYRRNSADTVTVEDLDVLPEFKHAREITGSLPFLDDTERCPPLLAGKSPTLPAPHPSHRKENPAAVAAAPLSRDGLVWRGSPWSEWAT